MKLDRVRDFLRRESLQGVLIRTAHNFAWITAGGSNQARAVGDEASALFLCADGRRVLIAGGDSSRLQDEVLRGMGYELREVEWFAARGASSPLDPVLRELASGGAFGSDSDYPGARLVAAELADLRVPLTDTEVRKYRWLGRRCARAAEEVARLVRPGMTERGIEALVSGALMKHAIRPVYIRVATDDRISRFPLAPGSDTGKLEKVAMMGLGATRWGLHVTLTRSVHFGTPPRELQRRLQAAAGVQAGIWAGTLPGASAGSLISGAISDYAASGFGEEWRKNSQGGAIGYQVRDWLAVPGSDVRVRSGQAFAWNPTVEGIRMEDTIPILGDRLEVLTEIPGWPVVEARASGRTYRLPSFLVR